MGEAVSLFIRKNFQPSRKALASVKRIRQLHLYLGLFLAPTVIFFAFSGALQIFRLQESHPGSTYEPPAWMVKLAGVHKDQRIASPPAPRPAAPQGEAPTPQPRPPQPAAGDKPPQAKPSTILKWFFLFASIGIITTTVLGCIMAFKYNRDRRVNWGLLASGFFLPIVLLLL
jgi:hypothetical protein